MILMILALLLTQENCTTMLDSNYGIMATHYTVSSEGALPSGIDSSTLFRNAMGLWGPCAQLAENGAGFNLEFKVNFINQVPPHGVLGRADATETKRWVGDWNQEIATEITIEIFTLDLDGGTLNQTDLTRILAHEIGHGLGLNHTSGNCPENLMNGSVDRAEPGTGTFYSTAAGPNADECQEVKNSVINHDPLKEGTFPNGGGSGGGGGGHEHNLCFGVVCPIGHECQNGACMPDENGCVIPCPIGFTCMFGMCVGVFPGDPDCDPPFNPCAYKTKTGDRQTKYISLGRGLILCVDMDRNGLLQGRREVFRGHHDLFTGVILGPWDALAQYDLRIFGGNENGFIDPKDAVWTLLRVHSYGNRFGLTQHPESLGLERIDLPF